MKTICLDLEGVLVPEIWIEVSKVTGISELERTTRDEPDYDKLMAFRLELLKKHKLKLKDIQSAISEIEPLLGALEFSINLRMKTQLIILSDTFEQFAQPLMRQLNFPTLFCNTLITDKAGNITGWQLRQKNGKKCFVEALKNCNVEVFAAGDSFNDIAMIERADSGALFRPPEKIRKAYKNIKTVNSFAELDALIDEFLRK